MTPWKNGEGRLAGEVHKGFAFALEEEAFFIA